MPPVRDAVDVAFLAAVALAAATASGHAVIYTRDSRSASIWVLVIWILPALGPILYALVGVNRVERRAAKLRRGLVRHRVDRQFPTSEPGTHFTPLARLVEQIVGRPLCACNAIDPLIDGPNAYPAMLQAIGGARASIAMASYIFDADGIGAEFVGALGDAVKRGVEVRVLIDDVDARFSSSNAVKPLQKAGVNVDSRYFNPDAPESTYRDLHFRLRGPVVAQLMEVFADDWQFSSDEALRGPKWFPPIAEYDGVLA